MVCTFIPWTAFCSDRLSNLLRWMKRSTTSINRRLLCNCLSSVPQNSLGMIRASVERQNADTFAAGVASSMNDAFRVCNFIVGTSAVAAAVGLNARMEACVSKCVDSSLKDFCVAITDCFLSRTWLVSWEFRSRPEYSPYLNNNSRISPYKGSDYVRFVISRQALSLAL